MADAAQPALEPFARRGVLGTAGVVALVLVVFSGRYGYHRDELYFLQCGQHLAFGYPDQPPLTPLLARWMSAIDPTSLRLLRLPSDIAAAGTVALSGGIARQLGARASGQTLTAVLTAICGYLLGSGHLLSTTTFCFTDWTALTLLVLIAIRSGQRRWWPIAGVVAGIGLQDSDLIAFLMIALAIGVLVSGPRQILRNRWLYLGVVIAIAIWMPYLIWQGLHRFPELKVANSIAHGGSGTSTPRWALVVDQIELGGPPFCPIWIAGLVRLLRRDSLRSFRYLGVAWIALVVIFVVTGGKSYYLANTLPMLFAAGAQPAIEWCASHHFRRGLGVVVVITAAVDAVIALPVVPINHLGKSGVINVNYDLGEQVAWREYVGEIVHDWKKRVPADYRLDPVVVTSNYGEDGALAHYAAPGSLPPVYGVQNADWLWGPPPESTLDVMFVGFPMRQVKPLFSVCVKVAKLHNSYGVDDDEQGAPIIACSANQFIWTGLWDRLQDYG